VAQFPTRLVHNVAIDPLDENYFISAGPMGEPTVAVWDKRFVARSNPGTPSDGPVGPVLEFRPAVDSYSPNPSQPATIWSLRYSGFKRGCFGVLSSTGEMKIIELAQYAMRSNSLHSVPGNPLGGTPWTSPHYTRKTHNLQYPWFYTTHGQPEDERVIACDFMPSGNPLNGPYAIALRHNRDVELLRIPDSPPLLSFTALNELYLDKHCVAKPRPKTRKCADELNDIRKRFVQNNMKRRISLQDSQDLSLISGKMDSFHDDAALPKPSKPSWESHDCLLAMKGDPLMDMQDTLTMAQAQKWRCQEGYMLDAKKNKSIVADDPWLVEAWDLVDRLDKLKEDNGMIAGGYDMSYLGVEAILTNRLATHPNPLRLITRETPSEIGVINAVKDMVRMRGYTAFHGIRNKYPEHRQLCLAICGWDLPDQDLREESMVMMEQGDYYRAIVLAVFKGHKDLALDLLKYAVQHKLIQIIGLAAIIAVDNADPEQRAMCRWMADETEDPYLKALLAYFASGTWNTVCDMEQLALKDRIGVALKHYDDKTLLDFIQNLKQNCIEHGDIEGLVLTGLDVPALDILSTYIAKHGAVQDVVLLMARVQPLYIMDDRLVMWHESYLWQMQEWRAFNSRARLMAQHNQYATNRNGLCLIRTPPAQITIRCSNCQLSLARRTDVNTIPGDPNATNQNTINGGLSTAIGNHHTSSKSSKQGPKEKAGLVCPQCGAEMPRCAICMMRLGTPDPAKLGGAEALKEEDALGRQIVFCMKCGHGFHGHHARDWFARHKMCPVPDCQCMCGMLK
jgi:WD repeat-containing protein mio